MGKIINKKATCIFVIVVMGALLFATTANATVQKPGPIRGLKCAVKNNTMATNWSKTDRAKGYEVKYVITNSKGKVKKNVYHINKTNHLIKLNPKPYPVKKVTATIRAYNYSKKGSKQYGTGASVHVLQK